MINHLLGCLHVLTFVKFSVFLQDLFVPNNNPWFNLLVIFEMVKWCYLVLLITRLVRM